MIEVFMKDCRCGMSFPYTDCCGPLIRGVSFADTAEDLMRSRYTAYTQGNWDYLIQTTCSEERPHKSTADFEKEGIEWQGLDILDTRQGGREDVEGEVTFVARYTEAGEAQKTSGDLEIHQGKRTLDVQRKTIDRPRRPGHHFPETRETQCGQSGTQRALSLRER